MSSSILVAVLLLSPFCGFLINGLLVRFNNRSYLRAGTIGTVAAGISFVCAFILWRQVSGLDEGQRLIHVTFFNWLSVGQLKADMGFLVDPISCVMILIITGVGSLIHLYSIGYMSHDAGPAKFFSYLNLFLFNMLLLVLGDNLLVMFVGWEGVGLCSYLLIGFWFSDAEKASAGMKAFVTNRIGDAGFLIGMFLIFIHYGSLEFLELAKQSFPTELVWGPLTFATFCLFIGATGKSAQIPLYVWLPDAMAGPTPVSALIHAATMVTAGIYMIVRLNFMFVNAPITMGIVATIGALTAFFAATIGVLQNDIKKILAYSTVSQLGYMFLGVGVGAFTAGFFHLMTHAFFKALMFLGAGSVIHGMHEEQDVRKMGGLAKKMPITHWTFVCGWLAIIGAPLFSGFFSKDEILWRAFSSPMGSKWLWLLGVAGAILTAFYMTRLMALTFWGRSRVDSKVHAHESTSLMTIPLIALAILSVIGGFIGIPALFGHGLHIPNMLDEWLAQNVKLLPEAEGQTGLEWASMILTLALVAGSAYLAYFMYVLRPGLPERLKERFKALYRLVDNKYFIDELYFTSIVRPVVNISRAVWAYIDVRVIDRTTYLISDVVKGSGQGLRLMINGSVQQYALYIVFGIIGFIVLVFMR